MAFARMPLGDEWHKPRLFLGPAGGGKVVDGTRARPGQPDTLRDQEYLDTAAWTIPVAGPDQPFPHRRALQRVMVALRAGDYNGVAIHGARALGRATFADRVLRRNERDRARVVVARDFDALAIIEAIRTQTARSDVHAIAERHVQKLTDDPRQLLPVLREILEGPCQDAGAGAIALVLHGFDPVSLPNAQPDARHGLSAPMLPVARALIGAFAGARTESRLLFTSAEPFSVVDQGVDLADSLLLVSLECR